MPKVTFVIGATATGKTYFITQQFAGKDVDILNVYDYQEKAYDEAGYGDRIPFGAQRRCLYKANQMHLNDIIESLLNGRDVVAEQTFFKAKRRIAYIDAIRRKTDAKIEVYVMNPSDEQWERNIKERELSQSLSSLKEQLLEFEFPNPSEGFDAIYEVTDGEVRLRMDPQKQDILDQARKELAEEAEQFRKEEERISKHKAMLKSMETEPFWHYCEVCGKKEFLTARDAHDSGWDYPPMMGEFGLLSPRTCGDCPMNETLWWKINVENKGRLPIVIESELTPEEMITWRRIKAEPESLMKEE